MRSVVIRFTSVYPSLNKILRMHHRKRNALKREYQRAVGAEIKAANVEPFPGKVRIELDILFESPAAIKRDADNYQPKWLLDALVKNGVIKDDDPRVIPEPLSIKFVLGEPRPGVDVRITEVE